MFIERVHSEGLSHISYYIGGRGAGVVVDPRRDCEIYRDIARRNRQEITHIFETHRNEDYVIGSRELAETTGAEILHGAKSAFEYGTGVREGESFEVGGIRFGVLETPGHTEESISVTIADMSSSSDPVGVFTGDALFVNDVGRTDFIARGPELLWGSLFEKLLSLGDHLIIYPAHGAGSICGSNMSRREFSTIGYERRYNPSLQKTRPSEFVQLKSAERHYRPPYFKQMEVLNLRGPEILGGLAEPHACDAERFAGEMSEGMQVIDARSPEGYGGAHIPGSLAIPSEHIPTYAGWFLRYDTPLGLVVEEGQEVEKIVRYLVRMGYDMVRAYLAEGMHDWETAGRHFEGVPQVYVGEVKRRLEEGEDFILLDVRTEREWKGGRLRGATHIFLGELPERMREIPREKSITTFCGSGHRAIIAASILKRNGYERVENCLGSMAACRATACPIETGD